MADIVVDGMTRAHFVATIANPASVTTAEFNAGLNLTLILTAAGLEGFEASPADIDNTSLGSTFDTRLPGVPSFSGTRLILKKQTGTDTAYNTLTVKNTTGFIVIRRNIAQATAAATGQSLQVYPGQTGAFDFLAPERNTVSRYWVQWAISSDPIYNAVFA